MSRWPHGIALICALSGLFTAIGLIAMELGYTEQLLWFINLLGLGNQ